MAKFPVQCVDQATNLFAKISLYVIYLKMAIIASLKDFFNKEGSDKENVCEASSLIDMTISFI